MADKIIYQVQDLRKHFGQKEVLKGITLAFSALEALGKHVNVGGEARHFVGGFDSNPLAVLTGGELTDGAGGRGT